MREIGTLPDERQARILADHLLTLDITTKLSSGPSGWTVWVHNENRLDQARREFQEFRASPEHPRYHAAIDTARERRLAEEAKDRAFRRNYRDMSGHWDGLQVRRAPVAFILIGLSILVSLWTQLGNNDSAVARLTIASYQVTPQGIAYFPNLAEVRHGEVWRLVTPIFLHFGPFHILFNMMWMFQLGRVIEIRRGTPLMLLLVLVSAVISNLGQFWFSGPSFGGMSGVNCALFGYAWVAGRLDPTCGLALSQRDIVYTMFFLILFATGAVGPIANVAHFTGLGVGMAMAYGQAMLGSRR